MDSNDFTLFERFVDLTDFIWHFFNEHPFISLFGSAAVIIINWSIFKYHFDELKSYKFFMKNIEVTGRFCGPSYDMWKTLSMTLIPFGAAVIVFSIFTKGDTKSFLATFGTKGSDRFKWYLVKKSIKGKRFEE